jgi:hypothetical protein
VLQVLQAHWPGLVAPGQVQQEQQHPAFLQEALLQALQPAKARQLLLGLLLGLLLLARSLSQQQQGQLRGPGQGWLWPEPAQLRLQQYLD